MFAATAEAPLPRQFHDRPRRLRRCRQRLRELQPEFDNLKIGVGAGVRYLTPVGPAPRRPRLPGRRPTRTIPGSPSMSASASLSEEGPRRTMIRAVRIVLYVLAALVVVVGLLLVVPRDARRDGRWSPRLSSAPSPAAASRSRSTASPAGRPSASARIGWWSATPTARSPRSTGLSVDLAVAGCSAARSSSTPSSAERVVVSREPVLPSSEGGGDGALPLMARQFSVARLELGEGLIGNPAALSLAGAFATRARWQHRRPHRRRRASTAAPGHAHRPRRPRRRRARR